MTTERWTDETLDRFALTVATAIPANNDTIAAGNERMDRLEHVVTELTQVVGSNNGCLESFSQDFRRYNESLENFLRQYIAFISHS
jgi:hypothetical protein